MTVFARGQCGKTLANGGKSFHSIDLWRDVFPVDLSLWRIELQVRLVISITYQKTALGDLRGKCGRRLATYLLPVRGVYGGSLDEASAGTYGRPRREKTDHEL
jgi:hypothetical protein